MDTVRSVAFGLFHDRDWARGAQNALKAVGFASEDIGLLESRRRPGRHPIRTARSGESLRRSGAVPAQLGPPLADVGPIGVVLVDEGMPEDQARYFENEIRHGNSLVAVRTRANAEVAQSVLHRFGAYDVKPFGGKARVLPVRRMPSSRTSPTGTRSATRGTLKG